MRAIIGSVAIHAVLVVIAMRPVAQPSVVEEPTTMIDVSVESPVPVESSDDGDGGGGANGGGRSIGMKLPAVTTRGLPESDSGWAATTIGFEGSGDGGTGTGRGGGHGNGLGLGRGAVHGALELRDVPPPPAPHVSKARPAKLLHPTRSMEVEADELFAALVTVDATGDVIGARMTRSHPGSRGDTASSMIWQFRYAPALDDDGNPTRSTFVQTFAVR